MLSVMGPSPFLLAFVLWLVPSFHTICLELLMTRMLSGWSIARGAAVVITLFVALGFITARAVEYIVVRWWKHRQKGIDSYDD